MLIVVIIGAHYLSINKKKEKRYLGNNYFFFFNETLNTNLYIPLNARVVSEIENEMFDTTKIKCKKVVRYIMCRMKCIRLKQVLIRRYSLWFRI